MEAHSQLKQLIREQVEIERESVARLTETEKKVGADAAKLLLTEMRMDSQKHAAVLEAVLEVLNSPPSSKSLWERSLHAFVDPIIIKRELEHHKGLGNSMLTHLQDEIRKTDDDALRTLFEHLAEDEKRHHEILDTIAQKCYRIVR